MEPSAVVQCIPNFSEGRRLEVIEAIAEAIAESGVKLLSVAPNPEHNRTVVAFLGQPAAVAQAALRATEVAVRLIDLNQHRGGHPRMGAVDVIPFIPVSRCDMADCVTLAAKVGEAIGEAMSVPVFLYDAAATRPDRRRLADVRQGGFEELRQRGGLEPDFGPNRVHPTAGATAVGARMPLLAFEVKLDTSDALLAQELADGLLESMSGVGSVQVDERPDGLALAVHITDYLAAPLAEVLDRIRQEAARRGAKVAGTALSGMVPMDALIAAAAHYLQLEGFKSDQVLEKHLME